MQYRKEIDGFRAIAVVPVILFHAGLPGFSGGFVGVDVFFVISGYLITTTILEDIGQKNFSITKFYERRARRILPALFTVLAATLLFAWIWLLPDPFVTYSQSLISAILFVSNFFFSSQKGYFLPDSHEQPLIHTWSLSVEEQFYVIFPLMLLALMRQGRKFSILFLLILGIASFAFSQFATSAFPQDAFYSAWSRAWELLTGTLCAFADRRQKTSSAALGLLGLTAILLPVFMYDETTPFPGAYAAIPAGGAALVLLFARSNNLTAQALSTSPLVFIGIISYSAYLWHQPILAFLKIRFLDAPAHTTATIAVVLTLILAWLTWKFIEQPFHSRKKRVVLSQSSYFQVSAAAGLLLLAFAFVGKASGGFPSRFTADELKMIEASNFRSSMVTSGFRKCFIDYDQSYQDLLANHCADRTEAPAVLLFGDSEAAHLKAGVAEAFASRGYKLKQWTATGCRPFDYPSNSSRCVEFLRHFWKHVAPTVSKNDIVVVGANWSSSFEDLGETKFSRTIRYTFARLANVSKRVVIVGDVPNFEFNPTLFIVETGRLREPAVYVTPVAGSVAGRSNQVVESTSTTFGLSFLDPSREFCLLAETPKCAISSSRGPLFFDENHLSNVGSAALEKYFLRYLN